MATVTRDFGRSTFWLFASFMGDTIANVESIMKTETITIVDVGRGPQLSTSRITVQDLLPFYRDQATNDEIRRWMPSLGDEEIAVLKDYLREHLDEALRLEQQIKAHHDRLRSMQPEWVRSSDDRPLEERKRALMEKLAQQKMRTSGADDSVR